MPEVSAETRGVLEAGTVSYVNNENTYKNLKLLKGGSVSYQYAVFFKIYHANTNRIFIVECNNGIFTITKLTKGDFLYKFYLKDNYLYVSINSLASFHAFCFNFANKTLGMLDMSKDNIDLSDAEEIIVY